MDIGEHVTSNTTTTTNLQPLLLIIYFEVLIINMHSAETATPPFEDNLLELLWNVMFRCRGP